MSQPSTPDLNTDMYNAGSTLSSASKGLSLTTKKRLGISAAALLLGGGAALAFMPKSPPGSDPVTPPPADPTAALLVLPPNAPVAHSVTDGMSFETAFGTARDEVGLGGVFMWNGQPYNTFLKEEWTGLSLQQRQEYAEHVLDAKLPIGVQPPVLHNGTTPPTSVPPIEAKQGVMLEGILGDRRVMGIDDDNDGVIDTLLIEGENGYTYRVVDAAGDEGLDTMYVYDAIKDDYVVAAKLDEPFVLTNDAFNQELEQAISKAAVDELMAEPTVDADVHEAEAMLDDTYTEEGRHDTYINDANVDDMHHPAQ
jgi:hypothetical protein